MLEFVEAHAELKSSLKDALKADVEHKSEVRNAQLSNRRKFDHERNVALLDLEKMKLEKTRGSFFNLDWSVHVEAIPSLT